MIIEIVRAGQTITLPKDFYEMTVLSGLHISVNKRKFANSTYYQVMIGRKINGKLVRTGLARTLMNAPKDKFVDHIDRNPLNNDPKNLRFADVSQNGANRSHQKNSTGYKGVNFANGRYRAICNKNGKRHYNGEHNTAEEAARARDELAIRLFGEYAALNFPKKVIV